MCRAPRPSSSHACAQENPNVGENLRKISEERELLLELLSKTLIELQEGRFDSLLKHVSVGGKG